MHEHDLYPPIKAFLEAQGYEVKAEVDRCDVVAMRRQEPPVIIELKTAFSLTLVFQGIARQGLSDNVYLAVPAVFEPRSPAQGRAGAVPPAWSRSPDSPARTRAFRRSLLDPGALSAAAAQASHRAATVGVPAAGGRSQPRRCQRRKIVTVYRQDALRCALHLNRHGPSKAAAVAASTGVGRARAIMYADHYGWFERAAHTPRGIYTLTPTGRQALEAYADAVAALENAGG